VRGEEAVNADLLLRHEGLEERGLGEAESTRRGGSGSRGGRLLGWWRRRRGRRRHRGGRDAPARTRASSRNRRRHSAGCAEVKWSRTGGDCDEEMQVGVGGRVYVTTPTRLVLHLPGYHISFYRI